MVYGTLIFQSNGINALSCCNASSESHVIKNIGQTLFHVVMYIKQ